MAKTITSDARKKDTREKIELGGLIVKAGLRYEKRSLLLGLLLGLLLQRCGKSISVNAGKQFGDCQFICQALVTVDLNLPVEDGTKPFAVLFFTFVWFRPRV